jgi:hypothetical protein
LIPEKVVVGRSGTRFALLAGQEDAIMDTRRVEIGRIYTVEIERKRLQVKVLKACTEEPGWFLCETTNGTQIRLLPSAFCEQNS